MWVAFVDFIAVSFCMIVTVERGCWDGYSRKKDSRMMTQVGLLYDATLSSLSKIKMVDRRCATD